MCVGGGGGYQKRIGLQICGSISGKEDYMIRVMVFNTTLNTITVIS